MANRIQYQSLDNIAHLASQLSALKALGVDSVEQLTEAALLARPELEAYLGTNLDQVIAQLPAANPIPPAELALIQSAHHPLGVALSRIPPLGFAPTLPSPELIAKLPASVNFHAKMTPVRDQADRGTCVAFATVAVIERRLAQLNSSEQFMYWNCKRSDGAPDAEGTTLGTAFPLAKRDGCCLESQWKYNPKVIAGDEGQGPPPAGAMLQAAKRRLTAIRQLAPTSILDIKVELAALRPVAFAIPVFNSWYQNDYVAHSGDIGMPVPGEANVGGHAMCLVGYVDMPASPEFGGGRFIVRNSWGTKTWGIASTTGPGYGTIPYAYITKFCAEAFSAP